MNCSNDSSLDLNDNFTIEFWFRLDETDGYEYLISKSSSSGTQYAVYLYGPRLYARFNSYTVGYSGLGLQTGVHHEQPILGREARRLPHKRNVG